MTHHFEACISSSTNNESSELHLVFFLKIIHTSILFKNLWDGLDPAVSSRFSLSVTLIELKIALQEEWRLINCAVVDHLIEKMATRCKLSIQVRVVHIH